MKKLFALLLTALLVLSLTACGSAKIEDTNGPDNFALNTITDQNILKLDLPSAGSGIKIGGLLSKTAEFSGKDFSGVVEILWTDMLAGDFVLDLMDFAVTGGNFRMVVINEGKIVADDTTAELSAKVSKDRRLTVSIEGPVKEVTTLISGINGVEKVVTLNSRETGVYEYSVDVAEGADIRRDLFTRLAQRGWPLLSSKSQAMSLEDIFINLTIRQNGGMQ